MRKRTTVFIYCFLTSFGIAGNILQNLLLNLFEMFPIQPLKIDERIYYINEDWFLHL